MIGFFEKLFVFVSILTGMIILFLFGLYFDVGDMFAAAFEAEEAFLSGHGDAGRMMESMIRQGRPVMVEPGDLGGFPGGGGGGDDFQLTRAQVKYYGGADAVPTGRDFVKIRELELRAMGFRRSEYVEMESLSADRHEFKKVTTQVRFLVEMGQHQEAIASLKAMLAGLEAANHLVRRDLLANLVRLHYQVNDVEQARRTSIELYAVIDRIIANMKLALAEVPAADHLRRSIEALEHEKTLLDQTYRMVEERIAEGGSHDRLTADERRKARDLLEKARTAGQISTEEYEKALQEFQL